jgi:hypothetical protein
METKTIILEIFQECRENPKGKYDEENFLNGISTSHAVLFGHPFYCSSYKKFIRRVQEEFKIYFPQDSINKLYSLDGFVDIVDKLCTKRNESLTELNKKVSKKSHYKIEAVILIVGIITTINVSMLQSFYYYVPFIFFILFITPSIIRHKSKKYHFNLLQKIELIDKVQ